MHMLLLRKEVIQPQVPLRLPCYDFIPITSHTFGTFLGATSGATGFHDVTGGVYKAAERIDGALADAPLLAIPASCRRVADDNLNWARFLGICSTLQSCFPLCRALYYVCSPGRKGHSDLTSSPPPASFKRGTV